MSNQLDVIKNTFQKRQANILGHENFLKSSVMIPLVTKDNEIYVLFEVRSKDLKHQPGEICFPGGKIDSSDINEEFTAKREASEELGIHLDTISILFPLDILVTPIRGIIYPFVGEIVNHDKIKPNISEVSETFLVPLSYLLNFEPKKYEMDIHLEPQNDFPFQLIPNKKTYKRRSYSVTEYFYFYEHYVIWGLTARVLHHFLELLKSEGIS